MLKFVQGISLSAFCMLMILASAINAQAFQERFQKHYIAPNKIDAMQRFSAIETSDGGIIAAYVAGDRVVLVKTDACGDTEWSQRYELEYYGYALSTEQIIIQEITSPSPAYVIAGSYAGDCCVIFLLKVDAITHAVVWNQIFDGG